MADAISENVDHILDLPVNIHSEDDRLMDFVGASPNARLIGAVVVAAAALLTESR